MMSNIFGAQIKLHFADIPESAKNRLLIALIALQSIAGIILGVLCFAAAWFGPTRFVNALFTEELAQDPGAPLVHFLLHITRITTAGPVHIFLDHE